MIWSEVSAMKVTAALFAFCVVGFVHTATAADQSLTLTAGVITQVLPPAQISPRVWERIVNVGLEGINGTAWCSRYDQSPAPKKPGSFPIAPHNNSWGYAAVEEFQLPAYIPQLPLWCTADQVPALITAETAP